MRKLHTMTSIAALAAFANETGSGSATAKPAKAQAAAPVISAVSAAVPIPELKNKRGGNSIYPFDQLTEIGQSFGVKGKTAETIRAVVSNANRKALDTVKDAAGNVVYDTKELDQGNGVKINVPDTSKPKKVATKKFVAADVDPKTDPDGANVRVWRVPLDA
jgi:hypothetical protein